MCGVDRLDRRLVLGLTNRVGMVRREDDRLEAVGSRGGLGKGGILPRALRARSNHTPAGGVDAWRMCATHRTLRMLVRYDLSWEKSYATAFHGVTGPSAVRLDAAGNLPAALRSRSR